MANRISDRLPASSLRLLLFAGFAGGVLTTAFASPAYAVNPPTARGSEARQAPAGYQVADDQGRWHGREVNRGGSYNRGGWAGGGPAYYYSAPPVVVVPYGYYQQPPPLFDLTIPLVIR